MENETNEIEEIDIVEEFEESEIAHFEDVPLQSDKAPVDLNYLLQDLPSLLEALIFAASEPLTTARVLDVFERKGLVATKRVIEESFELLALRWSDPERTVATGLELCQVAGGYAFRTKADFGPVLRGLVEEKPVRLSQAQLEVLSVVAYRQPTTRLEVEEIRGVDCSASMRRLLNVKLIKILGKSEGLGRPLLYGTTKHFLEFFGLNSLHDLPTLKEFNELHKDEKEPEIDPNDGPVTVKDLFAQEGETMFSEETEALSVEALKSLDLALGVIDTKAKQVDIESVLNPPTTDQDS